MKWRKSLELDDESHPSDDDNGDASRDDESTDDDEWRSYHGPRLGLGVPFGRPQGHEGR